MEEFDFMQARKILQVMFSKDYVVSVIFTEKKKLEIRGTGGILSMAILNYVYNFCAQRNLKYYVDISSGGFPAIVIFQ